MVEVELCSSCGPSSGLAMSMNRGSYTGACRIHLSGIIKLGFPDLTTHLLPSGSKRCTAMMSHVFFERPVSCVL